MPSPAGPRRVLSLLLAALACALAAAAPAGAQEPTRVTIAFLPVELEAPPDADRPSVLDLIGGHPELALGMTSATQSGYSPQQALLDLTAGTRTSRGTYDPKEPPDLGLLPAGRSGLVVNWLAAVARARTAPADVVPGLLAGSVSGGAGYVGIDERPNVEAVVAADREGRVAQVSLGEETTVAARTRALLRERRLVVVLLAPGYAGDRQLDLLLADRRPGELLIAMQAPPPFQGPQLLWTGIAGLGPADAGLTSATTHIDGVIAGIDVLPTVLGHLGLPVPDAVRGEPIRLDGARDADALQRLAERLEVVTARRIPTLQTFLFLWLAAVLLAGVLRDRAGVRFALRLGGLAIMWVPAMALVSAALAPSEQAETVLVAGGAFLLALATDRLVPWPRGPAVPALVALVAYTADLANDSHLVIRSMLGPSPRSGSRFYGLGNELEIIVLLLLLVAVAALLRRRERGRGGALAFALGGVGLALVVGSGRLGADVGGIFTIAGGAAVATLLMLPGGVTRRALAIALATPVLGLAALALVDLATGGDGHFVRNVLQGSGEDQLNTLQRRYELAWANLSNGYGPLLTILCGLAVAYAWRHRARVYAAVGQDPVWRACLGGGLGAALAGSLFNDSGPVVLFIGVGALAFLTSYLRAAPEGALAQAAAATPLRANAARAASAAPTATMPPSASAARGPAAPASQPISGAPIGVEPRKTIE